MSRLLLAACLGLSRVASAQGAEALDDRIRRLDSLVDLRTQQLRDLRQRELVLGAADTVRMGGLHLVIDRRVAAMAREGADAAWRDIARHASTWATDRLAGSTFFVFPSASPSRTVMVEMSDSLHPDLQRQAIAEAARSDHLRFAIANAVDRALRAEFDEQLARLVPRHTAWEGDLVTVAYGEGDETLLGDGAWRWRFIARELVLHPSRTNRACLAGSTSACAQSLGIDMEGPAVPSTWYDPGDLPWLARDDHLGTMAAGTRSVREACARGELAACDDWVGATPDGGVPRPAPHVARDALVALALEHGGADAVSRLLDSRGTLSERLAATAGMPFDSLMQSWQRRVTGAPQQPVAPPFLPGLVALAVAAGAVCTPRRRSP